MRTPDFSTEYEDILSAVDCVLKALEDSGTISNEASNKAYAQIYHQLELVAKGVEKPQLHQEFWIDDETFSTIHDIWQDENGAFCVIDPDGDLFVLDYDDEKKRWAIVPDEEDAE